MDHELILMIRIVRHMLMRTAGGLNKQKARLRGEPKYRCN
ncbi:hypothetical protein P781_13580 [Vibrio mimicus CAIM 1883]|nr:hypothetical protein P780_13555 [Vibrio mimicus CAIM 1882]ERM54577.1 hypothetical protein P781_13580 [Vibrio mimicus CAIM 1883]